MASTRILSIDSFINTTMTNEAYVSPCSYDISDASAIFELIAPGDWSLVPSLVTTFQLNDLVATWFGFWFQTNTVYAQYGANVAASATYDPSIHKYFRVGEAAGNTTWDISSDGSSWNNFASVSDATIGPFNFAAVHVKIAVLTNNPEANSTTAQFQNICALQKLPL